LTTRTTLLRRAAATVTAAAVALAGAAVLTATPAQAALKKIETPFAYQGSAYGTRVTLGDPSAGGLSSGRTAWSVLGCTKLAPIRNANGSHVAKLNANSMIEVGAVTSVTSTYRKPKQKIFGSRSVNKVASLTLGPEDGPQLKFGALTTRAHAFNDKGRFRAAADIDLADISYTNIVPDENDSASPLKELLDAIDGADNQLVERLIESSGSQGITIPGLGTIYPAGKHTTRTRKNAANASAFGIRVELENGSTANIGRAWSRIQKAHPAGVFGGHAYALQATVAEGTLGIGRTPYRNLPCPGTDGKWLSNSLAEGPKHGQLNARGLVAETFGKPHRDGRAVARARSSVSHLSLGDGALVVRAVTGQVNVFQNKNGRVVRRNLNGTSFGKITVNGETHELTAPGESLEIEGVAFIKAGVRKNLGKRGLRVHALQIRLLDTGVVVNVGTAKARIMR
jgi:hypothetical protein